MNGAERRKSQVRGTDFRALDLGRKTKRVQESIFLALDPGRKTKRVQEPIFLALDTCGRKRSLHNAKNKPWSGLRGRKDRARPGKEEKSGPRAHFSRAGSEDERKKFA